MILGDDLDIDLVLTGSQYFQLIISRELTQYSYSLAIDVKVHVITLRAGLAW